MATDPAKPHPLDGARFKVVRAQEHVDAFKGDALMYINKKPFAIQVEIDADDHVKLMQPVVQSLPPPRLSAICGDCVTNARAALDYILWELVLGFFDPPFDVNNFNDRRITAFPITKDPMDRGYMDRMDRLANRKVPAAAIDMIKMVQPHNRGYEPLWWLHELVNTDKHRMPLLTVGFIHSADLRIRNSQGHSQSFVLGREPGRTNLDYAYITEGPFTLNDMKVDVQSTAYVAWKDVSMPREAVDRTLEQIVETVANVIPRFDPFF